jgi:hypothetical protein
MKKGVTLIEMLIYSSLISIIFIAVLDLAIVNVNTWGNARALRNTNDGGRLIMERLIQELRLAKSVNSIGAGSIELSTYLNPTSSTDSTLLIHLDGTELKMSRDAGPANTLSGQDIRVSDINFYQLNSGSSNLVRIELTVESGYGKFFKEKSYTSAAVLRGGY